MAVQYGNIRTLSGMQAVVRNGYLLERDVLIATGPMAVKVPKVRDRSGTGATNPIESTYVTVRHRTTYSRNCLSRTTLLGLPVKLVEEAESHAQDSGRDRIKPLLDGVPFEDGPPAPDNPPQQQKLSA
jgi:hypothetical protein